MHGQAGLTGRRLVPRLPLELEELDDEGEPVSGLPRAPGKAIPANCLRVLSSPLRPERGGGCSIDCPGLQRDGSCLAERVRAANEQGIDWRLELDLRTGYWDFAE